MRQARPDSFATIIIQQKDTDIRMNATTIETLPTGYMLRAPREEDIPAILALLRDSDDAEFGQHDDWTAADIRPTGRPSIQQRTPGSS